MIKVGDTYIEIGPYSRRFTVLKPATGIVDAWICDNRQNMFGPPEITLLGKNLRNPDEYLLEFSPKPVPTTGCVCGLAFAREGGKHSSWCPASKKAETW
jgi:hypothetical protein